VTADPINEALLREYPLMAKPGMVERFDIVRRSVMNIPPDVPIPPWVNESGTGTPAATLEEVGDGLVLIGLAEAIVRGDTTVDADLAARSPRMAKGIMDRRIRYLVRGALGLHPQSAAALPLDDTDRVAEANEILRLTRWMLEAIRKVQFDRGENLA